jgi:hypothetical protein
LQCARDPGSGRALRLAAVARRREDSGSGEQAETGGEQAKVWARGRQAIRLSGHPTFRICPGQAVVVGRRCRRPPVLAHPGRLSEGRGA